MTFFRLLRNLWDFLKDFLLFTFYVQYMYHNLSITIYLTMAQYFIKTRTNMTEDIEVQLYVPNR